MKIERVTLRQIGMPLVHFFETSFSRTTERHMILVEVESGGVSGWGEVTAGENPFYNEEWTGSAWPLLRDYAIPRVLGRELASAADVYPLTAHIRGHNMARGGLETAIWDLEARQKGIPLWQAIGGGARREIPCGVSIGIQDSVPQLLEKIETELAAGYQRIKMKIKPGHDVDSVRRGFHRRRDDVAFPIALAGGDVARQHEIRQRGQRDVVRAPDAGLQHAAAPHRNARRLGHVVDPFGFREPSDPPQLDINDSARAQPDGLLGMVRGADAFVQANGSFELGLQLRMIDDVVVGQRLLDHHQVIVV